MSKKTPNESRRKKSAPRRATPGETAVIVDAVRSPMGVKKGKMVGLRADELTAQVVTRLLDRQPDLPREKFRYLGNSSLLGTYMGLVSRKHRERQLNAARRMTYLELNTDPGYMDQYTAALFLPHTDLTRFPSVSGKGS